MGTDRLTQEDYEQLAAFRHLLRRFASFSADAAREAGLTTNQHQALLAIMASMYAVYHGPKGLKTIALRVNRVASIFAAGVKIGSGSRSLSRNPGGNGIPQTAPVAW